MDKLKQFDKTFGVRFSKAEIEAMFVNNIEEAVFEKLRKNELCISYYKFIQAFTLRLGLNPDDFKARGSIEYQSIKMVSKSDFTQTMRFTVAIYDVLNDTTGTANVSLNNIIQNILSQLPAPIGIRWVEGTFVKDEFPEISKELIDDNLVWLSEFPNAKMDLQIALRNHAAGDSNGVLENIYKAVENVAQKITEIQKGLHHRELYTALFKFLNISDEWRQLLVKFIEYTNNNCRHGGKNDRYTVDPDEVESFLFLALNILRLISKKEKRLAPAPIDQSSLLNYITTSRLVRQIENEIISINPRLKLLKDRKSYNPVSIYLLDNIKKLGLRTIGEIEALYKMHKKPFVLYEQNKAIDIEGDFYGQGFSIVHLTNYVSMHKLGTPTNPL